MRNKTWEFGGQTWRYMSDEEFQRALELIAKEISKFGYEVTGVSAELECMDVWGYENTGKKRRRKCYLEIYASYGCLSASNKKFTFDLASIVFSHPDYDVQDSIEVLFTSDGIPNVSDLVTGIASIIEPLKRKRGAK